MKSLQTLIALTLAIPSASFAAPGADALAAAAMIDTLVEAGYDKHEVQPNRMADDATFVRRAHLDIIGRIPTAAEARAYIESKDKDKRAKLIDRLLDSPGYASHQFNYWADILRITSRMNGQSAENGDAYARWVKGAIGDNMPYDQFVRELVTAEGMIDENGAVGFYLRDRGMEIDNLATTVQAFLGTQLVCAQCHDHPFDEWTQMDYYKLAAFSTPMTVVRQPDSVTETIQMVARAGKAKAKTKGKGKQPADPKMAKLAQMNMKGVQRGLNTLTQNFRNSVIGETNRPLKLPHDYQYDDGKPAQVIHPGTPFGEMFEVKPGESRVQAYAKWMTAPENPRFTKTIANRLWKRAFGVGLFEPVDDIKEVAKPSNPELLAYLEKLMVDLDYDLKGYYRALYNTDTYAREAQTFDPAAGEPFHYPGPKLRRMSAEQVWDSLVTLMRKDVDYAKSATALKYAAGNSSRLKAWQALEKQSPEALLKRQAEVVKFTEDSEAKMEEFRERVAKVIKSKDGEAAVALGKEMMKYNVDATFEYARLTYWEVSAVKNGYFRTPFRRIPNLLFRELVKAFPKEKFPPEKGFYAGMNDKGQARAKEEREAEAKAQLKKMREQLGKAEFAEYQKERSAQARMRPYVRASELSSPAPDGHFLRTFGQSDRSLIENANDGASVPQALSLMNGSLFRTLTDPYSVLSKEIRSADDSDSMIDAVYLSMLSRKPSERERALLRDEMAAAGDDAAKGLVWTVLNTQQFLFIQ